MHELGGSTSAAASVAASLAACCLLPHLQVCGAVNDAAVGAWQLGEHELPRAMGRLGQRHAVPRCHINVHLLYKEIAI